ncbi:YcaO-like family protein [Falsiroseomonas sp.]|uniref:YcaO-like family protein n=1 Tax=Falsiroseomonas sp. TaxID=2870721 RepID=UPI003F70B846
MTPAEPPWTVFLGPSLRRAEAEALLPASYHPPARRGDVWHAVAQGARRILLIDGVFHQQPSVWQREILEALRGGCTVLGASSIGALRAAELAPFGMRGVGGIWADYRAGRLTGDDEVALLHGPAELGFMALSIPLVQLRAAARGAVAAGLVRAEAAAGAVTRLKALDFTRRDWTAFADAFAAEGAALPAPWLAAARRARRFDRKRADARAALRLAARWTPARRRTVPAAGAAPDLWGAARMAGEMGLDTVEEPALLAALRRRCALDEAGWQALLRAAVVGWFIDPHHPDPAARRAQALAFARAEGLGPLPGESEAALRRRLLALGPGGIGQPGWSLAAAAWRRWRGLPPPRPPAPAALRRRAPCAFPGEEAARAALAALAPELPRLGITRLADLTGLDRLGLPTIAAIRPCAVLLQVSNGKGLSPAAAAVGAVMEAAEQRFAEVPPAPVAEASLEELQAQGRPAVSPAELPGYREEAGAWTPARRIAWVAGEWLPTGRPVLLPAAAAYLTARLVLPFGSNGLAAGFTLEAATRHALLEAVERDAVRRGLRGGLALGDAASGLALDQLPAPLSGLVAQIRAAGVEPRLVLLRDAVAPTFLAALVDPSASGAATRVNLGHASHPDPLRAATAALLEAAQARLTFIHAAREDLAPEAFRPAAHHDRLEAWFRDMPAALPWSAVAPGTARDSAALLGALIARGSRGAWRIRLAGPARGIVVVRVLVEGLDYRPGLGARGDTA